MTDLSLTPAEATALERALSDYLSDLRMEIVDTDSQEFRKRLQDEEQVLTRVLANLRAD